MTTQNDNPLRNLGQRSIAALQLLLTSPAAVEAVAAAEAQEVDQRAQLVKRLQAMPEQNAAAIAPMIRRAEQTRAALAKAEAQLAEALKAHTEATDALAQTGRVLDIEATALTRRLEDGADPRLARFAYKARDMAVNNVRHTLGADGNEAFQVLIRGADRALALRLFALNHSEVTVSLRKIVGDIRPALAVLGIEPPAIDEDTAEAAPTDVAGLVH